MRTKASATDELDSEEGMERISALVYKGWKQIHWVLFMVIFHAAGIATPIVLVSVLNSLCSSLCGAYGLTCCEISNLYCL